MANLLCTLHYETPCILMTKYINLIHKNYCLLLFPQIILIKGFQKKPKITIYSAEKEKSAVLIFSHWYFSISPIQWKYKHSFYVSWYTQNSRVSYINLILLSRFYFLPTDHGTDFDAYEVVYQTWGHMILQYLLPLGVMITLNILMLRTVSKK